MSTPTLQQIILQRDGAEAVTELRDCIACVNAAMEVLASMFPGCTCLAGFACGEPSRSLVFARSRFGNHFTVGTMAAAQDLSKITANLPSELQAPYEVELRAARERHELEVQREAARMAALKVAGEGRH